MAGVGELGPQHLAIRELDQLRCLSGLRVSIWADSRGHAATIRMLLLLLLWLLLAFATDKRLNGHLERRDEGHATSSGP